MIHPLYQSLPQLPIPPLKVTKPKRGRKKKLAQPQLSEVGCKFPLYHHDKGTVPPLEEQKLEEIYRTSILKKYITSTLDPNRQFLTVHQYQIGDYSVLWDYETGYVHLTGIWKASLLPQVDQSASQYSMKADIVKLYESTPKRYQPYIKRVRGGLLRIQGTWMPYSLCKILCQRFCYHIRYQLIPIFGKDFPASCLAPSDPRFGELKFDDITSEDEISVPAPAPAPAATEVLTPPGYFSSPQIPVAPVYHYSLPMPNYTYRHYPPVMMPMMVKTPPMVYASARPPVPPLPSVAMAPKSPTKISISDLLC